MIRVLVVSMVFVFAGCTSLHRASDRSGRSGIESGEVDGAQNAPILHEPKVPKVAIVLGPGGAKTMAEAGVLKALSEHKIPIASVMGVEWGALIGAFYASKGQVHDLDWKLYKLDQIDLTHDSNFFGFSKKRTVRILDGYLRDNLGRQQLDDTALPFSCPTRSFWTGTVVWQRRGSLAGAIKKCLPFPPLFQPNGSWIAAATQTDAVVAELKKQGFDLVLLVDVLGSSTPFPRDKLMDEPLSVIVWQDVIRSLRHARSLATETIRVNTDGIAMNQFDKRKQLIQAGIDAGEDAVKVLSAKYGF